MAPVALSIAGVDSGGGAGVTADLKAFEAHGVWGVCAVTAVTAQNTVGVQGVWGLPADAVRAQIESVAADFSVDAAKTGMLGSGAVASAVAAAVRELGLGPLVVDPVLASSAGGVALADSALVDVLRAEVLPLATVVTPNVAEAAALVGFPVEDRVAMAAAASALVELGARVAMVTGGHLGDASVSADVVVARGASGPVWLEGRRLDSPTTHGTGCVLSAALAAELARGMDPADACVAAKRFVERAMAAGLALGRGAGPVNPGLR